MWESGDFNPEPIRQKVREKCEANGIDENTFITAMPLTYDYDCYLVLLQDKTGYRFDIEQLCYYLDLDLSDVGYRPISYLMRSEYDVFMDTKKACGKYNVSRSTIMSMAKKTDAIVHIGRAVRINVSKIDRYLDVNKSITFD